jgi:GNAT superfamily N-acetyltransferase
VSGEHGGAEVRIRPVEPDDAARLVEFHEGLTERTKELRYFTPHPHLSEDEVHRFTNVDHRRREALVAVVGDRIVGVGRYDTLHDPLAAELAFVVADDWQHHGIGRALLDALSERARANGIHRFVADTLDRNAPMIGLLRSWGVDVREEHALGRAEFVLTLVEADPDSLPHRRPAREGLSERRTPDGTSSPG